MSNFSIEFGSKSTIGSGFDTKIREQQDLSVGETGASDGTSKTFGEFMKDLVTDANASSLVADSKLQDVAAGRNKDLHGAVLAMEKADVQFRLLSQVRNKVIEAYREIMRMQV